MAGSETTLAARFSLNSLLGGQCTGASEGGGEGGAGEEGEGGAGEERGGEEA